VTARRWPLALLKLALYLVFNALLVLGGLFLYVRWAEWSWREVLPAIREQHIVQQLFVRDAYVDLVRTIQKSQEATFATTWDFDAGVALSRDMFASQEMFGETKYVYRPDIAIVNALVWSGLSRVGIAAAATPEVTSALARNKVIHQARFETDALGFKKTEFSWSPESLPIFFLGDSFTEGLWVTSKETFVNQVGVKLRASLGAVTPVNLGVNGYGALEMDWLLERHAPALRPAIVVANLFANDVHEDYAAAVRGEGIPEENYAEMFYYLQRMQNYCRGRGITLVVAIIPAKEQFKELEGPSVFHDRIDAWCRSQEIPCLDPRSHFKSAGADDLYLSWDPHFSPHGHAVYAEYLAPHLAAAAAARNAP